MINLGDQKWQVFSMIRFQSLLFVMLMIVLIPIRIEKTIADFSFWQIATVIGYLSILANNAAFLWITRKRNRP